MEGTPKTICLSPPPQVLTSPLELMRAVRRLSPQPQLLWFFHTMSVGGLWVAPAPEAQIWGEKHGENEGLRTLGAVGCPPPHRGAVRRDSP